MSEKKQATPDEKLTPERVARAIFAAVKPPDPARRKPPAAS